MLSWRWPRLTQRWKDLVTAKAFSPRTCATAITLEGLLDLRGVGCGINLEKDHNM